MSDWKILERPLNGPVAVVFVLGVVAGGILGWLAGRWTSKSSVDWLDLFTAIGTVGAVVVALWQTKLAHQREDHRVETTRRQEQDQNERRANLAATGLALRLESIEHDVDLIASTMELMEDRLDAGYYEDLLRQFDVVDLSISLDVLLAIAPLPNNCPDDVAAGLAHLAFTRSTMFRWRDGLHDRHTDLASRKKLLLQWSGDMRHACSVLTLARKTLVTASQSMFF